MGLEVANGNLCGIAPVTPWEYQFELKLIMITNVILHILRYFIVKNMFPGVDASAMEMCDKRILSSDEFLVLSAF